MKNTIIQKLVLILISAFISPAFAQMRLVYDIDVANTTIRLPMNGKVSVTLDWGDGTSVQNFESPSIAKHIYSQKGTYTITISGTLSIFGTLNNDNNHTSQLRLKHVLSWHGLGLTSLRGAFAQAGLLTQVPDSLPSTVTNLSDMFTNATSFNQPIGNWNTSNVTNMEGMFFRAISFNQPIGNWNTANVMDMHGMFLNTDSFNQPIGNWNTSNVMDMSGMFQGTIAFNQPIGNWNTDNVTVMSEMFQGSTAFNQPIGNWNTINVSNMSAMFYKAKAFNQRLDSLELKTYVNIFAMIDNSGMSCENFGATLIGWANNPATPSNKNLGANGLKYSSNAIAAHNTLTKAKGWTIYNEGVDDNCGIITEIAAFALKDEGSFLCPNPSRDVIYLHHQNLGTPYFITDMTGRLIVNGTLSENKVNISALAKGLYTLHTSEKPYKFMVE